MMHLSKAIPEEKGISSAKIEQFLRRAGEKTGIHSAMIYKSGAVVCEAYWAPYRAGRHHVLFSLSKTFTSAAMGFLRAEGKVAFDDTLISFFPQYEHVITDARMRAVTIRDALTMATGHNPEPPVDLRHDPDPRRSFFASALQCEPGTAFCYNTPASYMLSAIVTEVTGLRLSEYLKPRLLQPLGITNYRYQRCRSGIDLGGFGLHLCTRDILKFGVLIANGGMLDGRRILPEDWVREAQTKQIDSRMDGNTEDWFSGYGYQMWRCRHGAFRGDGMHGQYMLIMPEQEMVIAINAGEEHMSDILDLVWEILLPAAGKAPLAADPAAYFSLRETVGALRIKAPQGSAHSPFEAAIADRRYSVRLPEGADGPFFCGAKLSFSFKGEVCALDVERPEGTKTLLFGYNAFCENYIEGLLEQYAHSSCLYAWEDARTLRLTMFYDETPFAVYMRVAFRDTENAVFDAVTYCSWPGAQFQGAQLQAQVGV